MEKIKYAVIPKFTVRKKGKLIDIEHIEEEFRNWIKHHTNQGYVISRDTTISALLEPGCFSRLVLRTTTEFVDFAALEFKKTEKAIDYHYSIAPLFSVKVKSLSKKEKKKIAPSDWGFALFEKNREEFEDLINKHINQISSKGFKYNTSTTITTRIKPGCLDILLRKKAEDIDFEAYEFFKTAEPITYLCKVFSRFKSKWSEFSYGEMENDISTKVEEVIQQGYQLAGKIIFGAFMETGCLGKGEMVNVDAFVFQKI